MSDFTGNFWHLFVAGITLVGMIACLLLLWFSGKAKAMTANDNTTGHVWDGDLREMNKPLPRWWVGLFIITVVFSLVYLAFYPGLGILPGKFGWSAMGSTTPKWPRPTSRLHRCMPSSRPCPSKKWPRTLRPWPSATACS